MTQESAEQVASFILKSVKAEGIDHIFLVPGAITAPFLPAYEQAGVTAIVSAQEGGAAYMADGYGRAMGRFGVVMGIGGPGVTNMVTAISAAFSDRSRVLAIAGSIPFSYEGDGAFQDASPTNVDDHEIMRNMTVFAEVIPNRDKVPAFLQKAIRAMHGVENRPAFLSVPLDVQKEPVDPEMRYNPLLIMEPPRIVDRSAVAQIPQLITKGKRVVLLLGNGAVLSGAGEEISAFAKAYNVPVVTTLRAKGAVSEEEDYALGVFGLGGTLWANQAIMGCKDDSTESDDSIGKADVLLVLGATLNENNTYGWADKFAADKTIIRVDINPNNVIGKEYGNEYRMMGDVLSFVQWLNSSTEVGKQLADGKEERGEWIKRIKLTEKYDSDADRVSDQVPMHPARVIAGLRKAAPQDTVMVVDSGAHTFFAGHHWTSLAPNQFLMLSTTGPMGYGIAMAIGAKLARPEQPLVCVIGDGSFLMHGMELHTAVRYQIPIIIVVINNSALGNVYLHAKQAKSESAMELAEIPTMDLAQFAKSFGADGVVVEHPDDLDQAFDQAFQANKPFVIDARCDRNCPTPNTGAQQPN